MSDNKNYYSVTFLLQTKKWQEEQFNKRFKVLTELYNNIQRKFIRKFHYISQSKEFKQLNSINDYKLRSKELNKFLSENESSIFYSKKNKKQVVFSKYGIATYASKYFYSKNKDNSMCYLDSIGINSVMLVNISSRAWAAWEKFLYEKGKKIKLYKNNEEINSYSITKVVSNGKYNFINMDMSEVLSKNLIKILYKKTKDNNGKTKKLYMEIPFVVNPNSEYESQAFNDTYEEVKILRKKIRGKYKYYIQFVFNGMPYNKGRKIGTGNVGIDLGTSTIAISSDTKVYIDELAKGINNDAKKMRVLQRKLDRSRRANNPLMYNENGTIKRFSKKDIRPKWVFSKNYLKIKDRINNISRVISEKRKISHNMLCNNIMPLGNNFIVENNTISALAKRSTETKTNENGKNCCKKRFGKSIASHAPAMFIQTLENKLKFMGGKLNYIPLYMSASQFDFTSSQFNKHSLSTRRITLSNGNTHLRDTLAAFNIQHAIITCDKKDKKRKLEDDKKESNYNVKQMFKDYENFKTLEKTEIERHLKNNTKIPLSIGINI